MPALVYDAIRNKRYNTVSSEVYWNFERAGKKFSRALKAVALLGAEIPAVANLRPLHELFEDGGEWRAYDMPLVSGGAGSGVNDVQQSKGHDMTEDEVKALQTRIAAAEKAAKDEKEARERLEAKLNSFSQAAGGANVDDVIRRLEGGNKDMEARHLSQQLSTTEERLKAEQAAREEAEKRARENAERIAKLEEQHQKDRVVRLADTCRVPALRPFLAHFADLATRNGGAKVYSEEGQEVPALGQVEQLISYINDNAGKLFLTYSNERAGGKREADATKELSERARQYQQKNGGTYLEAMRQVVQADPALAEAYRATGGGAA
jgi:chromosome segregation ATPase